MNGQLVHEVDTAETLVSMITFPICVLWLLLLLLLVLVLVLVVVVVVVVEFNVTILWKLCGGTFRSQSNNMSRLSISEWQYWELSWLSGR